MGNRFYDGNFETRQWWLHDGRASYRNVDSPAGRRYVVELLAQMGVDPDGITNPTARCQQMVYGNAGDSYAVSCYVNPDNALSGNPVFVGAHYYLPDDTRQTVSYLAAGSLPAGWSLHDFGDVVAPANAFRVAFEVTYLDLGALGNKWFYIDGAQCVGQEPLVSKSTLTSFITNLKAAIAAIDPNIGTVFSTQRRLFSQGELEAAAAFTITQSGLFDDASRIGKKVTRFWVCEADVTSYPSTNCSAQYRAEIRLTAFWQFEEEDTQADALQLAAIEILDKLNTKTVELTDLSTGSSYLGFLVERPRMRGPVQPAELVDGTQGHTVTIELTFREEVAFV